MWDEIAYLFPDFISAVAHVLELLGGFISHIPDRMITYPYRDYSSSMLMRWGHGYNGWVGGGSGGGG